MDVALPPVRYADSVSHRRFFDTLVDRLRALPGVDAVSTASLLPLGGGRSTVALTIEGRPEPPRGQEPSVSYRVVGEDYFRMLDVQVLAGRTFSASDARLAVPLIRWYPQQPQPPLADRPQATPVAVIDSTLARRYFPDEDPVGRRIRVLFSPWVTIVGVVDGSRTWTRGAEATPELYLSDLQEPGSRTNVLIAGAGDGTRWLPDGRRVLQDLDAALPMVSSASLDALTSAELGLPRMTSALSTSFAAAAFALTVTGLYALLSFAIASRTREIGVRVALGATPRAVRWLVQRQSIAMGAAGILSGVVVWAALVLLLRVQMPDAFGDLLPPDGASRDAAIAGLAAATIIAWALVLGTWLPVRRAVSAAGTPLRALR
jgi:putative ABC transport system permease protein